MPSTTLSRRRELPLRQVDALRLSIYESVKRTLDVSLAMLALILLLPLFVAVAVCILLYDGGNPFFVQMRIGKHGREFKFYKFRSMVKNAEARRSELASLNQHTDDRTFKAKNDPRITPFGRWIRRTSIDELPQLVNVVQGHMSLVGPRPPLPTEVAKYTAADFRRLAVTPGLTCIWQISGRSEIPFPQQVEMDVDYINRRSLLLDLTLILLTVPALLNRRGAY